MNAQQKAAANKQLRAIKPGVNYPTTVEIIEKVNGKRSTVKFCLQSYIVGMYAAMYVNGSIANQNGDHNNKTFVTKLKRDIAAAIDRGATVIIGTTARIKTPESEAQDAENAKHWAPNRDNVLALKAASEAAQAKGAKEFEHYGRTVTCEKATQVVNQWLPQFENED